MFSFFLSSLFFFSFLFSCGHLSLLFLYNFHSFLFALGCFCFPINKKIELICVFCNHFTYFSLSQIITILFISFLFHPFLLLITTFILSPIIFRHHLSCSYFPIIYLSFPDCDFLLLNSVCIVYSNTLSTSSLNVG